MNLSLKKVKSLILLLLTLTLTITTFSFLQKANAEVTITINPISGHVGTNVTLTANITTLDGQYKILFDETELLSGNAIGTSVNVSIMIPPAWAGNHTIMIFDVGTGENATATFEVLTAYLLEISPPIEPLRQRQEGDSVEIRVNVTGGEQDKQFYVANITVQTPQNAFHVKLLNVTLSEDGSGSKTLHYPADFENANTSYVGGYTVSFNETLAIASFTIGLTNSTEYHRFQTVDIRAVGYKPEENVTLTITEEKTYFSVNLVADSEGVIHYVDWSVPSNASIGTYTVNITSTSPNPTIKNPPDIQDFTVPGFDVNITTRNLAEEPVPEVNIQIFENKTSVVNATSGSDGLASVKLEIGSYIVEAYFKERKVGEGRITVTESASFDVACNLTNLKVLVLMVVDGNEICVPEVGLSLSPENLILTPTLTTNISGTAVFRSLLSDINYTLNASRYGMQFNTTTLQGLLQDGSPVAWFNLTITCPSYTLQVNVTNPNAGDQPISNATVKVHEFLGGLYFERNATDGIALFNCPLGKYVVEVYVDWIKLNETTVNLNESLVNVPISCKLYGLNVSIQVVDYFGQPISNVNVTLLRNGSLLSYSLTKSDGTAEFLGIIGGELQRAIYLPGQSQPYGQEPFYIDSSTKIQVKVDRYVVLAGFLVETGQLATIIIIVVSVILVFLFEFYRRKRLKPKTGGSES